MEPLNWENIKYTAFLKKKQNSPPGFIKANKVENSHKIAAWMIMFQLAPSYLTPTDSVSNFFFQQCRKAYHVGMKKMLVCMWGVKLLPCIMQTKYLRRLLKWLKFNLELSNGNTSVDKRFCFWSEMTGFSHYILMPCVFVAHVSEYFNENSMSKIIFTFQNI